MATDPAGNQMKFDASNQQLFINLGEEGEKLLVTPDADTLIPRLSVFPSLNEAIDYCYDNSYRYLNIDVDYYSATPISYKANNVLFIGNGRIGSTDFRSYSTETGSFGGSLEGHINKFRKLKLTRLKNNSNPFVIVLFGVSIDIGYDFPGQYYESGVDQSNSTNSWPDYFLALLREYFPDKDILFYNRAIGGALTEDYDNTLLSLPNSSRFRTPANENLTWLQEIESLEPDLLINSLGMNDSETYIQTMDTINNIIATWAKVPETVVLTTPTPNYTSAQAFSYRLAKFHIQSFQNLLGRHTKQYQIDVARQYNTKVFGTDFNELTLKPSVFGYAIDPVLNATPIGLNSFTLDSATSGVKINTWKISRDFALKFTFSYSASFSVLRIGNALNGWFDITPTQIKAKPLKDLTIGEDIAPFAFAPATDFVLYLEFTINQMRAFVDGKLICIGKLPYCQSYLWEIFEVTGNTGTIAISDIELFDAEYRHFQPSFTQAEVWGALPENGNAINHPSEIGLKEIYFPPVKEFVQDMYKAVFNDAESDYIPIIGQVADGNGEVDLHLIFGLPENPKFTVYDATTGDSVPASYNNISKIISGLNPSSIYNIYF